MQVARYDSVIERIARARQPYGVERLAADLTLRRPERRTAVAEPVIVGFGASDWEQHGLWPALERAGSFHLMNKWEPRRTQRWPIPEERVHLGRALLEYVDEVERRQGPVHLVFMYADGREMDPAALAELRRRGIWTAVMALDDKQLMPGRDADGIVDWQLQLARDVDLYWTTWRAGIDWLGEEGARAWYAPEAADPALFSPQPVNREIDVLWLGRAYGPRLDLITFLRARGLDVRTFGPGWESGPVPFEEMIRLFSSARVVLGMGGVGQTDAIKHLKGRDFEVPMCGAVYVTSFNPELCDHFDVGREIFCYSSMVECAESISWLLRREDVAQATRLAARARCLRDHTWDKRVSDMLTLLGLKAGESAANSLET